MTRIIPLKSQATIRLSAAPPERRPRSPGQLRTRPPVSRVASARSGKITLPLVVGMVASFVLGGALVYFARDLLAKPPQTTRAVEPAAKRTKLSALGRLAPRGGVI